MGVRFPPGPFDMESVWGKGEDLTLDVLCRENLEGNWLDLGAGDGRYVSDLLKRVNHLVVADIDKTELQKIQLCLSRQERLKVSVSVFDMAKRFPFGDRSFDGVFCTGTLHLFTPDKIAFILSEISRILKSKGKIIIDFATDVKRVLSDGNLEVIRDKPSYILEYKAVNAKKMLTEMLKDYRLEFFQSTFEDDLTSNVSYGFHTKGNFFLVIGTRQL